MGGCELRARLPYPVGEVRMSVSRVFRGRRCGPFDQGFTLVEILIAAIIVSMLLGGVFKVYQIVMRTHESSSWVLANTNTIRNGLTLLRQDLARSTQFFLVGSTGAELDPGFAVQTSFYGLTGAAGATQTVTVPRGDSQTKNIMRFSMCQPRRILPGEPVFSGEIVTCRLKVDGDKLVYERVVDQPVNDDTLASRTQDLVKQIAVGSFTVQLFVEKQSAAATLSVKLKNFCWLTVTCQHPRYGATKVVETLGAPFEVPVAAGNP